MGKKTPAKKTREILRMKLCARASHREIARACNVAKGTVYEVLGRAKQVGIEKWEDIEKLSESELDDILFPRQAKEATIVIPNWAEMHDEMKKNKHLTRELLWQEYRMKFGEKTYHYSQFCDLFRKWRRGLDRVMRQEHKAGEKVFVDFAGDTVAYHDDASGEVRKAHVFVAVLGASAYTFAKAYEDETKSSWVDGHVSAFEFFQGVPEAAVPDNPRALVTRPDFSDPEVNPLYQALGEHYGFVIIPARVRKPKDKSRAENGVALVERWVLACLRKQVFHSLAGLNTAISGLLERLNAKNFRKRPGSRTKLFVEVERAALRALPAAPFELEDFVSLRCGIDYHITLRDQSSYSVPHRFANLRVDVRVRKNIIEVSHDRRVIAVHERVQSGQTSTKREHMPSNHRIYAEVNEEDLLRKGEEISADVREYIADVIGNNQARIKGVRVAAAILHIGEGLDQTLFRSVCRRAKELHLFSKSDFVRVLEMVRSAPMPKQEKQASAELWHQNIRGPAAFRWHDNEQLAIAFESAERSDAVMC